jgi:hypothetical protein
LLECLPDLDEAPLVRCRARRLCSAHSQRLSLGRWILFVVVFMEVWIMGFRVE